MNGTPHTFCWSRTRALKGSRPLRDDRDDNDARDGNDDDF
jgi:hypothetical protein